MGSNSIRSTMREIRCIFNGKWIKLSDLWVFDPPTFSDLFKLNAYMKIEGIIFITSTNPQLNIYKLPNYE